MTSADRQIYETPPRCSVDASAEAARKTEVGFTLQTLIVMAVFVLAAVGAGIGLIAVTTSSSDDFEDAGKTGVEERCAPNEIWDPELESRGIGGPDSQGGIRSRQVGCEPYCGTWEYLSTGANENGEYEPAESPTAARQSSIGGPEGNGGVYSQNIGCFAPCYWSFGYAFQGGNQRPTAAHVRGTYGLSRLLYFDDDRAPVANQFRLGVNYRRSADLDAALPLPSAQNPFAQNNDLDFPSRGRNNDGKHFFLSRHRGPNGARFVAGTLPLAPEHRAAGFPTVFKPNWVRSDDENWEVRADPSEGVCTIVDISQDDQVICSSEWDSCADSP